MPLPSSRLRSAPSTIPARSAVLPQIVGKDELLAANSFFQSTIIVVGVAGTATAGVIAGIFDTLALAFVIDAATFAVSAALVAGIAIGGRPSPSIAKGDRESDGGMWRELRTGLRYIVSSSMLRMVVVTAGVVMLGLGAVNVLLVPFIVDELAVPETWFGLLEAAQVTSMVLAGALIAVVAKRIRPGSLLVIGLTGVAVVVAAMSLARSVWHLVGASLRCRLVRDANPGCHLNDHPDARFLRKPWGGSVPASGPSRPRLRSRRWRCRAWLRPFSASGACLSWLAS